VFELMTYKPNIAQIDCFRSRRFWQYNIFDSRQLIVVYTWTALTIKVSLSLIYAIYNSSHLQVSTCARIVLAVAKKYRSSR